MRRKLILFTTLFLMSNVATIAAQEGNKDRIIEIESQIAELQSELKSLTKDETSEDSDDIIAVLEDKDGKFEFKEAYIYDDENSPSGKSILFIVDYTNTSGSPTEPQSAFNRCIDAEQESEFQVFSLKTTYDFGRSDIDSYKNKSIALKDGATIEFEFPFRLQFSDRNLILKASWLTDKEGEIILEVDPNTLEDL